MIKQFFLLSGILTLAACSSQKYTYNFDTFDYNIGKKKTETSLLHHEVSPEIGPLVIPQEDLTASVLPQVLPKKPNAPRSTLAEKAERYKDMSRDERKDFKRELKKEMRTYAKEINSGKSIESISATEDLDDELKLAIIFGAVGITLTILGGFNTVFWVLGVVGLVIGLVFFIRWISRQ